VDYVRVLATNNPRIDTSRVIAMGHSAGGALAVWVASRRTGEQSGLSPAATAAPLKMAGAVSLAGVLDMATYGEGTTSCNAAVHALLDGAPDTRSVRYDAVDPIRRAPLTVPVRLVYGARDPIVPVAQSQRFLARTHASGGDAELEVVAGLGHFDLVAPQTEAWSAVVRAMRSLVRP
jgi:pimeloyl-ACP methyl ester carboxylesterase